jgi:hypothetical protein
MKFYYVVIFFVISANTFLYTDTAIYSHTSTMKVLPHVIRNINEFNIPPGDSNGYEILYFGVNLILMFDYSCLLI